MLCDILQESQYRLNKARTICHVTRTLIHAIATDDARVIISYHDMSKFISTSTSTSSSLSYHKWYALLVVLYKEIQQASHNAMHLYVQKHTLDETTVWQWNLEASQKQHYILITTLMELHQRYHPVLCTSAYDPDTNERDPITIPSSVYHEHDSNMFNIGLDLKKDPLKGEIRMVHAFVHDLPTELKSAGITYISEYEWYVQPGHMQHGRGDLVLTNGNGISCIVECKYLTDASGATARTSRRKDRQYVKIQAKRYADAYINSHPFCIVIPSYYINDEGFTCLHSNIVLDVASQLRLEEEDESEEDEESQVYSQQPHLESDEEEEKKESSRSNTGMFAIAALAVAAGAVLLDSLFGPSDAEREQERRRQQRR